MSKWTDAKYFFLTTDCRYCTYESTGCSDCMQTISRDAAIEALEIAERTEKIERMETNADEFIYDRGYARGYNQALKDVRGESDD